MANRAHEDVRIAALLLESARETLTGEERAAVDRALLELRTVVAEPVPA